MKHLKFALVLPFFFCSSSVFSQGLYLGAGLGAQQLAHTYNYQDISTGNGTVYENNVDTFDRNAYGLMGNLLIGWGTQFNTNWYLGGEAKAFLTGAKSNKTENNLSFSPTGVDNSWQNGKLNGGYALSLQPGYYVANNTLLFVDLGWSYGSFTESYSELESNASGVTQPLFSTSTKQWRSGFEYGAGIQLALNNKLSLRGQILQTQYQKINIASRYLYDDGSVDATSNIIKPMNTTVGLDLIWNLGNPLQG